MAENVSAPSKKITLKSGDGDLFDVSEAVAMEIEVVKLYVLEDDAVLDNLVMPVTNVSSQALSKIIEFIEKRIELQSKLNEYDGETQPDFPSFASSSEAASSSSSTTRPPKLSAEIRAFVFDMAKSLSNDKIKELLMAANYLNVQELLDLLMTAIANRIKNKSVEYVRDFFGIENDFTPEEEEKIREEYHWAFENLDED